MSTGGNDLRMDSEAVLQRMVAAGLVDVDGDRVSPTEAFQAARERIRAADGGREPPDWLTADLVAADHLDTDLVVTARAVADVADGMDHREVGLVATVLDRLDDPPTADVPAGFVPLHQEDLRGFLARHDASVLFVWKPGSRSCERMADALGELHATPEVDESLGLGSICVEDGAELLREEYDVALLPTVLFFVGEAVDCRIIGPRPPEQVAREVEIIAEAAGGTDGDSRTA